jgi:endonuclease III
MVRSTTGQTQGRRPKRPSAAQRPARSLVESLGGRFATELGIKLESSDRGEVFKWFLAAILFAARISNAVAARTYREFQQAGVSSPQRVVETGWDGLVAILDAGGYVRYDFKTADKLLAVCAALIDRYAGDMNALHRVAAGPTELEAAIQTLGKGIGPMTANIFLREMRGIWDKAAPLPSEKVIQAAKELGFLPPALKDGGAALTLLRRRWIAEGGADRSFAEFEAALVRHALGQRGDNKA